MSKEQDIYYNINFTRELIKELKRKVITINNLILALFIVGILITNMFIRII